MHISNLLLLSMFAIAARYSEEDAPLPANGNIWEAGLNYMVEAREVLSTCGISFTSNLSNLLSLVQIESIIIRDRRPAKRYYSLVCESLELVIYLYSGHGILFMCRSIGSMEHGWLYSGRSYVIPTIL